MDRPALKEWEPPKPKQVYTETLRGNPKPIIKNYVKRDGDMYTLLAEFPIIALSRKAAWNEAVRAAKAIVSHYLIKSVAVEFVPKADNCTFEHVRVFEILNTADWQGKI